MVYIIHLTVLAYLCLSSMIPGAISRPHQASHSLTNDGRININHAVKPIIPKRNYDSTTRDQAVPLRSGVTGSLMIPYEILLGNVMKASSLWPLRRITTPRQAIPPSSQDNVKPAQQPKNSPVSGTSNSQEGAVPHLQNNPKTPAPIDPVKGMPVNQTPKLPAASPPTGLVTGKPLPQASPSESSPSPVTGDQGNNLSRVPPTDSLPAGVDNGVSTPANNTNGQGDSDISISESEFQKAVQAAGGSPTAEQYKYFAEGVRKNPFSNKREVAMFLANVLHESGGLQYKAEIKCQANGGCPGEYGHVPGEPTYYGRGYIQLTWKENYRAASLALLNNDELVKNPDLVATDEKLAWGVSFHYWFTRVHTSEGVINGRFGDSISKINGALECGGGNTAAVAKRQGYFTKSLSAFGVNEQPDFSGC